MRSLRSLLMGCFTAAAAQERHTAAAGVLETLGLGLLGAEAGPMAQALCEQGRILQRLLGQPPCSL